MPMLSPIQLDDFERAIHADAEVLGMLYLGSLGRGTATRFSDLDILVWVADDLPLGVRDKLLQLLELFGETHWLGGSANDVHALVGPTWTQVDLILVRHADIIPDARYAGARVVKDTDGVLAHMTTACQPDAIVETVESATDVIHGAIGDQLFNARHNARGSVWSAMGGISYWCYLTYELLGRLRGRRTYGYRYVEELLTPEEQALLTAAWPREPVREENRRAARALWAWIKYVWREAERVIGQPLDIELDEEGMLVAIDRMYE